MRILAVDTSTLVNSVALVEESGTLADEASHVGANHSDVLLGAIDRVLRHARSSLDDVDTFAVGLGPGSFTGVRIGVATLTGLQLATDRLLVGVPSLQALAASATPAESRILAALDARRGEVFYSVYERVRDGLFERLAPQHAPPSIAGATLRSTLSGEPCVAIGDLDESQWEEIESSLGRRLVRCSRVVCTPSARFVAAEAMAGRGVRTGLEPLYVRPGDAKLPGER